MVLLSHPKQNPARISFSKLELPDDHALVSTTKLIVCGTTEIPARVAAITNGLAVAVPVPVPLSRSSSSDGTSMPTKKMDRT